MNEKGSVVENFRSLPHPRRDVPFLLAHGFGINRRGGKLGVSQPVLHEVKRNAGLHRHHPEPMPQPLRAGMIALYPRLVHQPHRRM